MPDGRETPKNASVDLGDAVRARVEQLRGAASEAEARKKELNERERNLENLRHVLEVKQKTIEERAAMLDRREKELESREKDLDRYISDALQAQRALDPERERIDAAREDLESRERDVRTLEDAAVLKTTEIEDHLRDARDRVSTLIDREQLLSERESALAQSLDRLVSLGDALATREKDLRHKQEVFARAHNGRLAALWAREEELAAAVEALSARIREQDTDATAIASILNELRTDLKNVASERERLVQQERKLLEIEQSIASIVGVGSPEPATPEAPTAPSPAATDPTPRPVPDGDPSLFLFPPQVLETNTLGGFDDPDFATVLQSALAPPMPVAVGAAIQKMSEAFQRARQAEKEGWETEEVRELMRDVRGALEDGDYERALLLSEAILERVAEVSLVR